MKIKIHEVREILNLIFYKLDNIGVKEVELDHSYYWETSTNLMYDMDKEPNEFSIGDLTHDLERLQELLNDDGLYVNDSLEWIANILKYCGLRITKQL